MVTNGFFSDLRVTRAPKAIPACDWCKHSNLGGQWQRWERHHLPLPHAAWAPGSVGKRNEDQEQTWKWHKDTRTYRKMEVTNTKKGQVWKKVMAKNVLDPFRSLLLKNQIGHGSNPIWPVFRTLQAASTRCSSSSYKPAISKTVIRKIPWVGNHSGQLIIQTTLMSGVWWRSFFTPWPHMEESPLQSHGKTKYWNGRLLRGPYPILRK